MSDPAVDQTLQALDTRSREIFRMIVDTYLKEGEPLGSRNLSRMLPHSLSPATVRNVMSDLEHLGLVYAPHISAGRLPTQKGLRLFIDAFLEVGDLSDEERNVIEAQMRGSPSGSSLEHMLTEASQLLSGLSRGAGLVLATKSETALKHIEFIQLEPTKALAVLVSQNGDVENRVVDLPAGVTAWQLHEASNYLNAHIRGRTLAEAKAEIIRLRDETKAALDTLSQDMVEKGLAVWSGAESDLPARLIVRGRANLLENVTAQADIELLKHLFEDLETKDGLMQLLDLAEEGSGRAHLHRLREPAVLAVRIVAGGGALSRQGLAGDRSAGRDRPDPAQLCAHRADGGLYRPAHQPHAALRPPAAFSLDFWPASIDIGRKLQETDDTG